MRFLALLLVLTSAVQAQRIPPGTGYSFTKDAKEQLDSIAQLARDTRKEQAACVVVSVMQDTVYVVARFGPPRVLPVIALDSANYRVYGDVCAWWQPVLHSHLALPKYDYTRASEDDQHTTAVRGVFGFILIVEKDGWRLKAYP